MGLFNPSGAHCWTRCTAQPKACEHIPRTSTQYSRLGNAAHELAARCLQNNTNTYTYYGETITIVEPDATEVFTLDGNMCSHVQGYVDRVRALAKKVGTNVIKSEERHSLEESNGYIDAWMINPACDHLYFVDLKYGENYPYYAEGNEQLMFYAMMLLAQDTQGNVKNITVAIDQPRCQKNPDWTEVTYTSNYIRDWYGGTVVPAKMEALSDQAKFVPGDIQCKWCPIKSVCTARAAKPLATLGTNAAALQVAPPELPDFKLLTLSQLGAMVDRLKTGRVKAWIEDAEKYLRQQVTEQNQQCVLPDGKRQWVKVEGKRSYSWSNPAMLVSRLGSLITTHHNKPITVAQARTALKDAGYSKKEIDMYLDGIVAVSRGVSMKLTDKPGIAMGAPQHLKPSKEK